MSCASSLGVIITALDHILITFGSHLHWRTPGLDSALDALDDLDQDQPGGHDGEHANEHLVGLEAGAGLADHRANSCGRSVDLADNHPDHAAADGETKRREHEGDGAWQDDGPE